MPRNSKTYVVGGAGVFGVWTAYELRRAGHEVVLVDQYGPANERASSGGETRIIRAGYGADEMYTRMAIQSLARWKELFRRTGHALFLSTGVLWLSKPHDRYTQDSKQTLSNAGVKFEQLPGDVLRNRYPQLQIEDDTVAVWEPTGGALLARQAVQLLVSQFVQEGGRYAHATVRTPTGQGRITRLSTSTGDLEGDGFVLACGAWLRTLVPDVLGERLFPSRQQVFFFGPPAGNHQFEYPQFPIWIDFVDPRQIYGFPDIEGRGFKIAMHRLGPEMDPDTDRRMPSGSAIDDVRAYLGKRFPLLTNAPGRGVTRLRL